MADLPKEYAGQIHDGLSWGGTWIPSIKLEVGDVGTFINGVFTKATDLELVGIPFEEEDAAHEAELTFASKEGVEIEAKAAGQTSAKFSAVAQANAGVKISFSRAAGIAMSLSGVTGKRMANRAALEQELRRRLETGAGWDEKFAVVVERLEAKSGSVLVSSEGGTKVEFAVEGDVPGGVAALGGLSAGAKLAYSDAMSQLLVGKSGLTPLYHTLRLKRGFWSGRLSPVFYRTDDGEPPPADGGYDLPEKDAFEIVDFDA
jgi:hypothetical protein